MTLLLTLLSQYWKPVAFASVFTAIYLFAFHQGEEHIRAQSTAAALRAEQSVILTERTDQNTTNEVSHAYQTKITAIDNEYAAALDGVWNAAGNHLPGTPQTVPGHHAAACPAGLSGRVQKALLALIKQADVQTARLTACQSWISAHQ